MPLFSLALGAAMFAAFAIGDDVRQGALSFGVMAAVAALFFFGGRSETLRGLGGPGPRRALGGDRPARVDVRRNGRDHRDHRRVAVGGRHTATTASPYVQLGALAGIAYIVAVAVLRGRS